MQRTIPTLLAACLFTTSGCGDDDPEYDLCMPLPPVEPPACGTANDDVGRLIPGPGAPGYDAALEHLAESYDRQYHLFGASVGGLGMEVELVPERRDEVEAFFATHSWDLDGHAGRSVTDYVQSWTKATGAFAGAGLAADAFRFGTLRDQGASCDAIERARAQLLAGLAGLHRAVTIVGPNGTIARALVHKTLPGYGELETTPLFDAAGGPLPAGEKNNGTWREDVSGEYPDYVWEDSASRDQLLGWVMGMVAAWEITRRDPSIDKAIKHRLRDDARKVGVALSTIRASGYDLEVVDPDGRTTLHGRVHEDALEQAYIDGVSNGAYALMALGIVGALRCVAESPELDDYLNQQLIDERQLDRLSHLNMFGIDLGKISNYSAYNMIYDAIWMALRYIPHEGARERLRAAAERMYVGQTDFGTPELVGQSFFDLVHTSTGAGTTAGQSGTGAIDSAALARGMATLRGFTPPPVIGYELINCDEAEATNGTCTAVDGTELTLLGYVSRGNHLIADQPLPVGIRPPSNYVWRTNPHEVNGGSDGNLLFSGADFRVAYWLGRWSY